MVKNVLYVGALLAVAFVVAGCEPKKPAGQTGGTTPQQVTDQMPHPQGPPGGEATQPPETTPPATAESKPAEEAKPQEQPKDEQPKEEPKSDTEKPQEEKKSEEEKPSEAPKP